MKIAQCTYTQAGVEIILNVYFDLKAFDLITPVMTPEQQEEFMRLTCDSIAAALPREKAEKYYYIKRIFKLTDMNQLNLLCTDGFLIDNRLNIPASSQAYAKERIKLLETDQLPTRFNLNNAFVKSMNEHLFQFEEEAKKNLALQKKIPQKETIGQSSPQAAAREFNTEKSLDILLTITQAKKEIRDLAEHTLKTLKERIEKLPDDGSNDKELLTQKINEIAPINEKFSAKTKEITNRISKQTEKLHLFKQVVIKALHEAAKQFHAAISQKMQDAPSHVKKAMQTDFNKKFSGIASLSETGKLNNLEETLQNLEKLSLQDLQDIISDDRKESPGLLQKCNTSFTEESPELQILMKQLAQLNKSLTEIFKDDPEYANQEMVKIIRIPFPRSFQFKFSQSAINYKNVVDDFCKSQKEIVMNLMNQCKKIMQINLPDKPKQKTVSIKPETDQVSDINQYKKTSDHILLLANKEHDLTSKYRKTEAVLKQFSAISGDTIFKSFIEKINAIIEKSQEEANNADNILRELSDIKSQVDIQINHHILQPEDTPNFNQLDQKMHSMTEKHQLLIAKNKLLEAMSNKLAAYDNLIQKIREMDLSSAKSTLKNKRDEAKKLLLQFIQKENTQPAIAEKKKSMLEQYAKIDSAVLDIDKLMQEVNNMQNAILADMDSQPSTNLEARLQEVNKKMQMLSSAINKIDENISGMRQLSSA